MTENPTQESELGTQTTPKKARKLGFFWAFYRAYGLLMVTYGILCIPSFFVNGSESFSHASLAIPLLWFLPVFLVKNHRRFATLLALMVVGITWAFSFLTVISTFFLFLSPEIKYLGGEGSPLFVMLGSIAFTVVVLIPFSIMLISGTGAVVCCWRDRGEKYYKAAIETIQGQFFWNLFTVNGLIMATSKVLQFEVSQLVYLLWFVPLLIVKYYRRIAAVLSLIPIVALLAVFVFEMKRQHLIFINAGDDFAGYDAMVGSLNNASWSAALYLMPFLVLLVVWIWATIHYFKDAKWLAAPADSEEFGAK